MLDYLQTTIDKFTFRVATDRLYSSEGVWIAEAPDDRLRVGVTDFVQQHSGDIAFANVKIAGTKLIPGEEFAALETVKANVSLSLPFEAVVAPGWDGARGALLDAAAYLAIVAAEAEREINQP